MMNKGDLEPDSHTHVGGSDQIVRCNERYCQIGYETALPSGAALPPSAVDQGRPVSWPSLTQRSIEMGYRRVADVVPVRRGSSLHPSGKREPQGPRDVRRSSPGIMRRYCHFACLGTLERHRSHPADASKVFVGSPTRLNAHKTVTTAIKEPFAPVMNVPHRSTLRQPNFHGPQPKTPVISWPGGAKPHQPHLSLQGHKISTPWRKGNFSIMVAGSRSG
jgi:hypothetical protein